jgi:hypothetical protein
LYENNEKKAIELVKKTKVQLDGSENLSSLINGIYNATWLDFANNFSKRENNENYTWSARNVGEKGFFLVSFRDEKNWGLSWEVNINEELVKFVNNDEYLSLKYGLSRLDIDKNFEITNLKLDTLKFEKDYNEYTSSSSKKIVYLIKASLINKSHKIITDAKLSVKIKVIYKDKTIDSENSDSQIYEAGDFLRNMTYGFKDRISKSKPWLPETVKEFSLKTKGIEEIYLNYEPEYVLVEISLHAEDPVGFSYDKNIKELDIKNKWLELKKGS